MGLVRLGKRPGYRVASKRPGTRKRRIRNAFRSKPLAKALRACTAHHVENGLGVVELRPRLRTPPTTEPL